MLGIGFTFDLGQYHATQWGTNVNEAVIDWPPSPWRVLRTLFAAGVSDARAEPRREGLVAALAALVAAPPPRYVLPATTQAHTRHYMPLVDYSPTDSGKKSLVVDAFEVIDRESELQVWWDVELDGRQLSALREAVANIGYLGRSESVCSARLVDGPAPETFDVVPRTDEISDESDYESLELMALAPTSSDPIGELTVSVNELRKKRFLIPPGTSQINYRVPVRTPPGSTPSKRVETNLPTVAHFRVGLTSQPVFTEAVTVATVLRAVLQSKFDHDRSGRRSPVLSGHIDDAPRDDQHQHAHYLVLPDEEGRRVKHLVVWAPAGLGDDEVRAITSLRKLKMRDNPEPLQLALVGLGDVRQLGLPGTAYRGASAASVWRSLTPFALPRHPKRRAGRIVDSLEEQVRKELSHRGLPDPVAVRRDVTGKWSSFRRVRPGRKRASAVPVVGVEIDFGSPVSGPISLGQLSHFGLGLFKPV